MISIYEQENELIRRQLLYEKTQNEKNEQMKNEFEQFKKEQIQIIKTKENQSSVIDKKFIDLKNELELSEKSNNKQMQMINELKTNNDKLEDQNKQLKDEIDKLKEELNKLKKEEINKGHILDAGQTEIVEFINKISGGYSLDNGNLVLKDWINQTNIRRSFWN